MQEADKAKEKEASIHTLNTQMLCIRSNRHRRLAPQSGPIHHKWLASIPFRLPLRPTVPVHRPRTRTRPRRKGYIALTRCPLRLIDSIRQIVSLPRSIPLALRMALTRRKIPTPINLNPDLRAKKKRRVIQGDGALGLVGRMEGDAREALAPTCIWVQGHLALLDSPCILQEEGQVVGGGCWAEVLDEDCAAGGEARLGLGLVAA